MIDRRNFLMFAGATALLLKLPQFSFAAGPQARRVGVITYIPRHIFFATRSPGAAVLLAALELSNEGKTVLCSFSNGTTTQFDANSSSLNIIQESTGRRVTRQSVLPRSLAAWVIDAVGQAVQNKRNPATITQLRDNFESFQRQSVLEAVTPISLYKLARESTFLNQITSVVWNRDALQFDVK